MVYCAGKHIKNLKLFYKSNRTREKVVKHSPLFVIKQAFLVCSQHPAWVITPGKPIESVVCCSSNLGYETIQFDWPFIFDHNCELKHKLPTPRYSQYLTHVHNQDSGVKDETAVHGCHCQGDMVVRMRKVLAIQRSW